MTAISDSDPLIYEHFFHLADPSGSGFVTGDAARQLLLSSGLPPPVLGSIWQLADPTNTGKLDKAGFFGALRLVGHVQNGAVPSKELLNVPGPVAILNSLNEDNKTMGESNNTNTNNNNTFNDDTSNNTTNDTSIPPIPANERENYRQLFLKNAPTGFLEGADARTIFVKSRLSNEDLVQVWSLADSHNHGKLDESEFIIAMHLIRCLLVKSIQKLPRTLPKEFVNANSTLTPASNIPSSTPNPLPAQTQLARASSITSQTSFSTFSSSTHPNSDWTISPQERSNADKIFDSLDKSGRGTIGAQEVVPFLTKSRLPEDVLAQIWDLSDVEKTGVFSKNEFAVAMHLVHQKLAGKELPKSLPNSLFSPQGRSQPQVQSLQSLSPNVPNNAQGPPVPPKSQRVTSPVNQNSSLNDLVSLNNGLVQKNVSQDQPTPDSRNILGAVAHQKSPSVVSPVSIPLFSSSQPRPLSSNTSFLQSQIDSTSAQARSVNDANQKTESEIARLSGVHADLQSKLSSLKATHDQDLKKQNELNNVLNQKQMETAKLSQQHADLQSKHAELQTKNQELESQVTSFEPQVKSLDDQIHDLQAKNADLNSKFTFLTQQHQQSKQLVDDKTTEIQGLRASLDNVLGLAKAERAAVVSAQQELEAAQAQERELLSQIEATKGEIEVAKGETETAKGEIKIITGKLEAAKGELEPAQKELETAEKELRAAQKELEEAKQQLAQQQQAQAQVKKQVEENKSQLMAQQLAIKKESDDIETQKQKLATDEAQIEKEQSQLKAGMMQLEAEKGEIEALKKAIVGEKSRVEKEKLELAQQKSKFEQEKVALAKEKSDLVKEKEDLKSQKSLSDNVSHAPGAGVATGVATGVVAGVVAGAGANLLSRDIKDASPVSKSAGVQPLDAVDSHNAPSTDIVEKSTKQTLDDKDLTPVAKGIQLNDKLNDEDNLVLPLAENKQKMAIGETLNVIDGKPEVLDLSKDLDTKDYVAPASVTSESVADSSLKATSDSNPHPTAPVTSATSAAPQHAELPMDERDALSSGAESYEMVPRADESVVSLDQNNLSLDQQVSAKSPAQVSAPVPPQSRSTASPANVSAIAPPSYSKAVSEPQTVSKDTHSDLADDNVSVSSKESDFKDAVTGVGASTSHADDSLEATKHLPDTLSKDRDQDTLSLSSGDVDVSRVDRADKPLPGQPSTYVYPTKITSLGDEDDGEDPFSSTPALNTYPGTQSSSVPDYGIETPSNYSETPAETPRETPHQSVSDLGLKGYSAGPNVSQGQLGTQPVGHVNKVDPTQVQKPHDYSNFESAMTSPIEGPSFGNQVNVDDAFAVPQPSSKSQISDPSPAPTAPKSAQSDPFAVPQQGQTGKSQDSPQRQFSFNQPNFTTTESGFSNSFADDAFPADQSFPADSSFPSDKPVSADKEASSNKALNSTNSFPADKPFPSDSAGNLQSSNDDDWESYFASFSTPTADAFGAAGAAAAGASLGDSRPFNLQSSGQPGAVTKKEIEDAFAVAPTQPSAQASVQTPSSSIPVSVSDSTSALPSTANSASITLPSAPASKREIDDAFAIPPTTPSLAQPGPTPPTPPPSKPYNGSKSSSGVTPGVVSSTGSIRGPKPPIPAHAQQQQKLQAQQLYQQQYQGQGQFQAPPQGQGQFQGQFQGQAQPQFQGQAQPQFQGQAQPRQGHPYENYSPFEQEPSPGVTSSTGVQRMSQVPPVTDSRPVTEQSYNSPPPFNGPASEVVRKPSTISSNMARQQAFGTPANRTSTYSSQYSEASQSPSNLTSAAENAGSLATTAPTSSSASAPKKKSKRNPLNFIHSSKSSKDTKSKSSKEEKQSKRSSIVPSLGLSFGKGHDKKSSRRHNRTSSKDMNASNGFSRSGFGTAHNNNSNFALHAVAQQDLEQLTSMGFSHEKATDALQRCDFNVDDAINYLLERE